MFRSASKLAGPSALALASFVYLENGCSFPTSQCRDSEPPSFHSHVVSPPSQAPSNGFGAFAVAIKDEKKKKQREDNLFIVSGTANPKLSQEISDLLHTPLAKASISRFADGEVDIKIDDQVRGKDVYFVQPCAAPCSDNIMEILIFISACRRNGAKRVTAVIPYFPFKHRRHGTISSSKYNSRFLSSASMDFAIMLQEMGVDRVVAVDLQRPGQGQEACFFDNSVPLEVVLTTNMMINHFVDNHYTYFSKQRPIVVVSPNNECLKLALKFELGLKKGLLRDNISLIGFMSEGTGNQDDKIRFNPLGQAKMEGADVIILDDLVDTAETICTLSKKFKEQGAKHVYVCASHALFTQESMRRIDESGITKVVTTNSLPIPDSPSDKIVQVSLGPLLSRVIWTEHFRSNLKNFDEDDDDEIIKPSVV